MAVIAILLPTYLLGKITAQKFYDGELRKKGLIYLSLAVALAVIVSEIYNMSH